MEVIAKNGGMGERLSLILEYKGLCQRELAHRLGVTEVKVSRYIQNKRVIDAETLEKIAEVLDIPIEYFFDIPVSGTDVDFLCFMLRKNKTQYSEKDKLRLIAELAD